MDTASPSPDRPQRVTHRRVASARLLAAVAAAAALFLASSARAEGIPAGWSWATDGERLTFYVDALDDLEDVSLTVRRAVDRRSFAFERGAMRSGDRWEVEVPYPDRTTELSVLVSGSFAGVPGTLEDAFTMEVLAPMDFAVDEATFDAEGRRFTMTMTQPAGRVELVVRSDRGELLAERTITFSGEAPGTPLTISWAQGPGNVLTVDVRAVSQSGAWNTRTYIPWKVEFEAAHVNFASGSAEIPESDKAMLRARLAEIRATADRVREWVEVKLYVGGYTDTVGGPADNQRLSEQRARAIAQFFVDEGFTFPVFFQGFGESALAVATADNADEPANRRAVFIMSTQSPPIDATTPRADWRRID